MKIILLNVLALFLFVACNNITKNKNIKSEIIKPDYKRIYSKRDENKDRLLFLDFWSFMGKQEFLVICDSLLKTRTLTKVESNSDTSFIYTLKLDSDVNSFIREIDFKLNPYFKGNHLLSISLKSTNLSYGVAHNLEYLTHYVNKTLNLYKTKYGEPIIKKDLVYGYKQGYDWVLEKRVIEITLPYFGEVFGSSDESMFDIIYFNKGLYENNLIREQKRFDEIKKKSNGESAKSFKDI